MEAMDLTSCSISIKLEKDISTDHV